MTSPTPRDTTQRTDCRSEIPSEPSTVFDDVGRALARGVPRRRAIGLLVKGLLGVALWQVGVRSAWASSADCMCEGQPYDPIKECCTFAGVQTLYPIQNLDACPNRGAHPGYATLLNGCGPAGTSILDTTITAILPNRPFGVNLTGCCDAHDTCYGTCLTFKDADCDIPLRSCILGKCDAKFPANSRVLNFCYDMADLVYFGVTSTISFNAYEEAQKEACDCCTESTCTCPGGVCGSFPACGSGCLCFTSAEGTGTCGPSVPCAGLQPCFSSSQCAPGYACQVNTCCGAAGICAPECASGAAAMGASTLNTGPTNGGSSQASPQ
jgi:hypothetical protein